MNFGTAIGLSVLAHGLLAVGLGVGLDFAKPVSCASLDLSSVELSFADEEDQTAAATMVTPSLAPEPPASAVSPPALLAPPTETTDRAAPPAAEAVRPPEPETPREAMVTPRAQPQPPPVSTPAVAPAAPRQAKVDAPPRPRRTIRPDYPKDARQRGEEGRVAVEITVGADGIVSAAHIVASSGFAELDAAALKAVREARFVPGKSDGRAVETTARLTLQFKLR